MLTLLLISLIVAVSAQDVPYKLTPDRIGDSNNYKLQCKNANGLPVTNAVFLRNGVFNTTDDCFDKLNETGDGYLQVELTSECDGHYMCGIGEGSGYVLSGPTELLITPTVDSTDPPNIQAEEGDTVMIQCPFSESPLGDYQVSLLRNDGGVISVWSTLAGEGANDLVLVNVTSEDSGMYFCRLKDTDSDVYNGPSFRLQVFSKFGYPQVTNDIGYSTSTGDSMETRFSVDAIGTSLTYQWAINETQYNQTEDGWLVYGDAIPNGRTKVKVVVSNVKYDGSYYSQEQVLIIEKGITISPSSATLSCAVFSTSTASGNANITLLVLFLVIVVTMTIIISITVLCVYRKRKYGVKSKPEQQQATESTDAARTVTVGKISIQLDSKSLKNLPQFLDKIDFILGSTLDSIKPVDRNPMIDVKIRELKAIVSSWCLVQEGGQESGGGQQLIPRGPNKNIDKFKLLLPYFNDWVEQNIQ